MAIDPELKSLLNALVEGQPKLAEGQGKTEAALATLALRQDRTEAALARLTGEVTRLAARVDTFAEAVLRGFTDAASRDRAIETRVERLESRVDALEREGPA